MQNLLYHCGLHGVARADAKARALHELERFELTERAHDKVAPPLGRPGAPGRDRPLAAPSAGNCCCWTSRPWASDIGSRQGILEHVRRLCAEDGIGVLWATHLIDEVGPDDQVVVLHQGRVLAIGDGAAICAEAEADDLRNAFTKLTGAARAA